jgi:hypothetical protein
MSLLLGYLYNYVKSKITDFAILSAAPPEEADELGMLIIQSEIDAGLFDESDYKTLSERLTFLKALFTKENIVSPGLKTLFGIPSTADSEPASASDGETAIILEHYETIFEMVYRLATKIPIKLDTDKWSYASILQNVCSKIYVILLNYDVIKQTIGEKTAPIINAFIDFTDTSDNATIFKRLKSIIVLGVAYNSYGWLFALVAPFAIPAAIGVTNWAICFLARLPFTAIKYAGTTTIGVLNWLASSGQPQTPFQPGQDGSLICVGHTITELGALVPYMVSKNDIHALSRQLQHAKLEKPSLVSSLFDASGAAGLDMQSNDAPDLLNQKAYKFLMRTHPIGNLIKCIDAEITDITNSEVGVIRTLPEIAFSVFFNTVKQDTTAAENGLLLGPVICFCADIIHNSVSGVRSGIIGTIRAIIDEGILGQDAIQLSDNKSVSSGSSVSSDSSGRTITTNGSTVTINTNGSSTIRFSPIIGTDGNTIINALSDVTLIPTGGGFSIGLNVNPSRLSKNNTSPFWTKNCRSTATNEANNEQLFCSPSKPAKQNELAMFTDPKLTIKIPVVVKTNASRTASPTASPTDSDGQDTAKSDVSSLTNSSTDSQSGSESSELIIAISAETAEIRGLNKILGETKAEIDEATALINEMKTSMLNPVRTDFIVLSVMDWIAEVIISLSPFKGGSFKRHRNVPILAEIKQKIVKTGTGLFNAIKPRLVRVKGRKSKRFAPKKGTKKWRKRYGSRRGTKKVYRKRYNTHKKRK